MKTKNHSHFQLVLPQPGLELIIEAKIIPNNDLLIFFYPKILLRGDFTWHRIGEGSMSVLSVKASLACFRKKRGRGWGGRGCCGNCTRKAKEF